MSASSITLGVPTRTEKPRGFWQRVPSVVMLAGSAVILFGALALGADRIRPLDT